MSTPDEGLAKLREMFPAHQVGKLAKGSKAQTQCQASEKKNCTVCGGWHHPKMIHLDYVGHAALTDRLLDADLHWTWEPLSFTPEGLPLFDASGGLWIRLTVCGHSRIGYGHAPASEYKEIGSREKEVIGDALRNAAMRFGSALEKWHKGELHLQEIDVIQSEPKKSVNERIDEAPKVPDNVMTAPQKRKFFAMCGEQKMNEEEKTGFREWLKNVKYQDPLTKDQASGIIEKFMDHVEEYQAWKFAAKAKAKEKAPATVEKETAAEKLAAFHASEEEEDPEETLQTLEELIREKDAALTDEMEQRGFVSKTRELEIPSSPSTRLQVLKGRNARFANMVKSGKV